MTDLTNSTSAEGIFRIAFDHHRAGRTREAEGLYRRVLVQDPQHHRSLYLLGVLAMSEGQNETAACLFERAISVHSGNPAYWVNLGECYRRAGRHEQAAATFARVVSIHPEVAEAHFNLGLTLEALENFTLALAAFERAAALKPDSLPMQQALAEALSQRGQWARAVAEWHRALTLAPDSSQLWRRLSHVLRRLGRIEAAVNACERAVSLAPESPDTLVELGGMLIEVERLDDALTVLRQVLDRDPRNYPALFHLGTALMYSGLLAESSAAFGRAAQLSDQSTAQSNVVFLQHFQEGLDASAMLAEARAWAQRWADPLAPLIRPHTIPGRPERRLRVGYVSPNFRDHCQSLFTIPLLSNHDRNRFEIFGYASVEQADRVTQQLRGCFDHWRDILGMDDFAVAELIRTDRIDILVDLTMHMAGSRLRVFAQKPAPVQICWLAYPGTTGLSTMDYRVTDPFLDPAGQKESAYSEASLVLPDSFWCYQPLDPPLPVGDLPAERNRHLTFGCLNNFCKVHDELVELWARILLTVEGARLLLAVPSGSSRARVLALIERAGVDPGRVWFVLPRLPRQEYLSLYQQIDIGLDTVPYNGHTTSLDAFWMGVPVVTLVGNTVVGRAGLSLATNLGHPKLIARTPEEYVVVARELAQDRVRLGVLRSRLRGEMQGSPLMDGERFARQLERLYDQAFRRWSERGGAEVAGR